MFHIKKAFMKSILNKKKKKQPFNFEQAEAFTIGKDGDGSFNNSYYFSAHSLEKDESLYTRLGLRDDGSAEVWVFFNKGTRKFYLKTMLYTVETAPLKVFNDNGWGFSFAGALVDDNGNDADATLDCRFVSNLPVVDFFQHMPTSRTATAIAQEKWGNGYFAEVQKNNSVHYEQEGVLTGSLIIGGEKFDIDLPCLRDHSFGRRVWDYMNNHIWLAAVDKKIALNFSMVSYPVMTCLEVGHLHVNGSPVEFVTKAHYDRNEIVKNNVPENLDIELTVNDTRKMKVKAKLLHYQPYVFGNGAYKFYEGIAEFDVDGIKSRGILEIGFNKDTTRFMNGKPVDKIRE